MQWQLKQEKTKKTSRTSKIVREIENQPKIDQYVSNQLGQNLIC